MITSPFKWNKHRVLTHPQLPVFDGQNQEDSNVWVEKTRRLPNFGGKPKYQMLLFLFIPLYGTTEIK